MSWSCMLALHCQKSSHSRQWSRKFTISYLKCFHVSQMKVGSDPWRKKQAGWELTHSLICSSRQPHPIIDRTPPPHSCCFIMIDPGSRFGLYVLPRNESSSLVMIKQSRRKIFFFKTPPTQIGWLHSAKRGAGRCSAAPHPVMPAQ